jgi:hypothetical protein
MPDSFPLVLRVALPLPLPRLFDYLPPPGHDRRRQTRRVSGTCRLRQQAHDRLCRRHRPADADPAKLRAAEAILDDAAILDPELDASLRWAAGYYQRALGEVIATALPGPLRQGQPLPDTAHALWRLTEAGSDRARRPASRQPAARAGRTIAGHRAGRGRPGRVVATVADRVACLGEARSGRACLGHGAGADHAARSRTNADRSTADRGGSDRSRARWLRADAARWRHRQRQDRGVSQPLIAACPCAAAGRRCCWCRKSG